MQDRAIKLIATLLIALIAASCASEPRRTGTLDARATARLETVRLDPAAATRILNAYRQSRGLSSVSLDPALTAMAQRQVDAMVARNEMSHDAGGSFSSRIASAGLDTAQAAENISAGNYSTQEVMEGWRNSPGHDANLLMPGATRIGIALAKDPRTQYRTYWALVIAGEPARRAPTMVGPVGYFGSNLPIPR